MTQAIMRWKTRKQFSAEIERPEFAMTRYEKVNRITMACGRDGLLMFSTEVDVHLCDVIDNVKDGKRTRLVNQAMKMVLKPQILKLILVILQIFVNHHH